MQIFPAIDLRGGQVVRLYQGDYDKETVYAQDPCAVARNFVAAGARYLHGVDLDGAAVDVSGTAVTITLPEARILSHGIDEDSVEVFNEKTSIFNPFTVEDFTSFQADQKAAMEERALSRGLLEEARRKAVSSVEQLLSAALPDPYTVETQ